MAKTLVIGGSGFLGSHVADILTTKGHEVYIYDIEKSKYLSSSQKMIVGDILDKKLIDKSVSKVDYVYHFAAVADIKEAKDNPIESARFNIIGTLNILEAIKNINKNIKFYQASSSEMYGGKSEEKLNEESKFDPKSPYAAAKVFSHDLTKVYRESYGMFCASGILFNHESPFRGETFVTRKISRAVGRIHMGLQSKLTLGNLDAKRDWGFAGDYVDGMYKILDYSKAEDWVIATGNAHSVEDFAKKAFNIVDKNYEDHIETSERYLRPNEVNYLLGDPSKANDLLNWESSTSFDELIKLMVENDIEIATKEKMLLDNGLIKPTWENPIID